MPKVKTLRAVVVTGPFASDWKEQVIENSLDTFQRLVGGHIEALPIDSSKATVYLNEEGKLTGLPATAMWYHRGQPYDALMGNLVILGPVGRSGETTGLTDEALAYVKEHVKPLAKEPAFHVTGV